MLRSIFAFVLAVALPAACFPSLNSSSRLVFTQYLLTNYPPNEDYANDIHLAQQAGIDAFALNYGGINSSLGTLQSDSAFAQLQNSLSNIYLAAQNAGFRVFISIDTASVTDSITVVKLLNTFSSHPAQLIIDNGIAFGSFSTTPPSWNWQTDILDRVFHPVYFIPGSTSTNASSLFSLPGASAVLSWPQPSLDTSSQASLDSIFASQRNASSHVKWAAGISPWFFERFNMAQNLANAQDDAIFIDRWIHLLQLQPDFIEIVSWNNWSDSSYIGPADSANSTAAAYWDTLDHEALRSVARVLIKAFKAHQANNVVVVEQEDETVFFFYRLQPAATNGTLDTLPLPLGWNYLKDEVYVVSLLNRSAEITLSSGTTRTSINATAGINKIGVPWGFGQQSLVATRNGEVILATGEALRVNGSVERYNGNVVAF